MGSLKWEETAWKDYLYWQSNDKKKLTRINKLILATLRTPFAGEGKPEPLRFDFSGYWSRQIDEEHRLVYKWDGDTETLIIAQCRYHYKK